MTNAFKDWPVVLFCGGTGTRIKEETTHKPKPMVLIGDKPILWHIMKIYHHYGFNKFIITLGYKGDYIIDHINKFHKDDYKDFDITLCDTGEGTKTGGRLLRVADHIKTDTFLCTYGDGVSNLNILKSIDFHNRYGDVLVTMMGVHVPHRFGIVKMARNRKLKSYNKGHPMKDIVHAGFMVMSKDFLNYLTDDMMVEDPFPKLASQGKQAVYLHKGYFGAVDTFKDLEELNALWKNSPPWKIWK